MQIAVTGASGLIGTALLAALRSAGHRAIPVVRPGGRPTGETLGWDPGAGTIDAAGFEGLDAVVHLAGQGIADRRWTPEQKQRILESRTVPTTLLAETLAALTKPPTVLVSGSAIGWYGNRGAEILTEKSSAPTGPDFLADVCRQWEAATGPAEAAGIRTVHVRTGIVLAAEGGVLARMATPFRFGLGGRIGSGRQYMSWIALGDEIGAIVHAITQPDLVGPVNATAPNPATNAEFTAALGNVLHRPTVLPTPVPALKLVYGSELVEHLLVEGQRVVPDRLVESGYAFAYPDLEPALRAILGR
ncbi:MAG: TIGR01777 family oxidoreductase [Acidimicrobiia bacterium]